VKQLLNIAIPALLVCAAAWGDGPLSVSGYVKNYSVRFERELPDGSPLESDVWAVANRLRLKISCGIGNGASIRSAYDAAPRFQDNALAGDSVSVLALDPGGYRLADFDVQAYPGAPETKGSFALFHNLDRLYLYWPGKDVDVTVGRQAIAWGSAHMINPTDVIAPYVFNALDQEERYGVDALRVRVPHGALGETDLGWVTGRDLDFRDSAFFVRRKSYVKETDLALLAVGFRRHLLLGLDVTRAVGRAGFWFEGAYVKPGFFEQTDGVEGGEYFRASVGLDSRLTTDTYGFVEYHFNSAGETDASRYAELRAEPAYRDGAVYLLGRHYVGLGVNHQLTPLVVCAATLLCNASDQSLSFAPRVEYNIAEDVYLAAGGSIGVGEGPDEPQDPNSGLPFSHESEFGVYADFAYASVRVYF